MAERAMPEPIPVSVIFICAFLAVLAILGQVLSNRGPNRLTAIWESNYFNDGLPSFARNGPLTLLPVAIIFSCWGFAALFSHFAYISIFDWLTTAFIIGSAIPFIIAVMWNFRGFPERVKPRWLIEAERRRGTKN